MSAFPKADVQDMRVGTDLNVRLWPKADIRTKSKSSLANVCFGEKSGRSIHDVTSAEFCEKGGHG